MDRFTDVEILRDVAMVAWRSNIPAYVILDEAHVSAFTEACEACNLHMGVLKVTPSFVCSTKLRGSIIGRGHNCAADALPSAD